MSHPVVLVSLAVLIVNDQFAKAAWPGPVTGIASDVAGLLLAPVVVAALLSALRRRPLTWVDVAAIGGVVAVGFAAVELVPLFGGLYERGLGVVGWPVRRVLGDGASGEVVATADPWDLLALPAAFVGALLWSRAERRSLEPAPPALAEVP